VIPQPVSAWRTGSLQARPSAPVYSAMRSIRSSRHTVQKPRAVATAPAASVLRLTFSNGASSMILACRRLQQFVNPNFGLAAIKRSREAGPLPFRSSTLHRKKRVDLGFGRPLVIEFHLHALYGTVRAQVRVFKGATIQMVEQRGAQV